MTFDEWKAKLPIRVKPWEGDLGWCLNEHKAHTWWGGATDNRFYLCINFEVVQGLEAWT